MGRKAQITKEMVLEAAYELLDKGGIGAVGIKSIASKLGCSTQPVSWLFGSMTDLKKELYFYDPSVPMPIANGTLYAYNKPSIKSGDSTFKTIDVNEAEYSAPVKSASGVITVPDTVTLNGKSYNVTSISENAFKGNKKIRKVVIGKNVKKIGAGAFQDCPNLKSVDMSKCQATSILKNTFKGSRKLSKLTINGDMVTKVGSNAVKDLDPRCRVTIKTSASKSSTLVKKLKKQGGKKYRYIFK